MKKSSLYFCFLIFFLIVICPQLSYASGIGLINFKGEVTIKNSLIRRNFNGIQITTTNAAKTIENLWIYSNDILDSKKYGMEIDFSDAAGGGGITIRNNSLDNSNIPSIAPFTKNGYFGIRIRNNPSPSIANNTVMNFGRSGIRFHSVNNSVVENNFLVSNGTQDYSAGGQHFASGIQLLDSHIATDSFTGNTIRWNRFSGVAVMNTDGTIGPNNVIMYNGDPDSGSGGGGGMQDCVLAAGGGGNVTGGVLAKDLGESGELEVCGNTIIDNYNRNYAHTGTGTVYSCSNAVQGEGFFATLDDAVIYMDEDTVPNDLDCSAPLAKYSDLLDANSFVNAGIDNKAFGIIIVGVNSNATIRNCTIKNAATVLNNAVTTGNGTILGAGIYIANDAAPSISNNYIYSNGWALLDDRIYTYAGASGIQMRCAEAATSIVNNVIASNANDGLTGRETGGIIGAINLGNTFRNNGRGGIGLYDGTTRNLEIAYNAIYSNKRGIGGLKFDGTMFTISNNLIYSNQGNTTYVGGIGFTLSNASFQITGNSIRNNTGVTTSNKGAVGIGIADSTVSNQWYIANNYLANNKDGYIGGIGFENIYSSSSATVSLVNNIIVSGGWGTEAGENSDGALAGGIGNISASNNLTWWVESNTIRNNKGLSSGAIGFKEGGGAVSFTNNTIVNNTIYECQSGASYMGAGLGLRNSTTALYVEGSYFSGNNFFGDCPTVMYNGGAVGVFWDVDYDPGGASIPYLTLLNNQFNYNGLHGGLGIKNARFSLENGILVSNNVFSDAQIGLVEIGGAESGGQLTPLIIANNTFQNVSADVGVGGANGAIHLNTVQTFNNIVRNNTITDILGNENSSGHGVVVHTSGLGYLSIYNNRITSLRGNGIQMDPMNGFGAIAGGNWIFSNYIFNNGLKGYITPTGQHKGNGIAVKNCATTDILTIRNNEIYSHVHRGIGLTLVNAAVILENTIANNTRGGIGINNSGISGGEIIISGNLIYSNTTSTTTGGAGIGFKDYVNGTVSLMNNVIIGNSHLGSGAGGIGIRRLASTPTFWIEGNTINSNDGWKASGIGIKNLSEITTVNVNILSNTLKNNRKIGISMEYVQGFTIENNRIIDNGLDDFSIGKEHYASGIQLRNSRFTKDSVIDNYIHSNKFAGISVYGTSGTIGRANTSSNSIMFNGDENDTGGLCAGVGGTGRGGISARGLTDDLFVEDPSYQVISNYTEEVQLRPGSDADFYYNGDPVSSTFWSDDNVALKITEDTIINCDDAGQNHISGGDIWGITVVGPYNVSITNCSISNNCTNSNVCDGDMGGGVLIAGGANVTMDNNVVHNNGYAALTLGEGKGAGVAIRCAGNNTTLINNIIENNLNDGLVVYDTNGFIGLSGQENTFRNNGRHGIGLNSFEGGTNDGPVIAYNRIYSNTAFGIGSWSLTNMNATILNNTIYSNHTPNGLGLGGSDIGGGIGLINFLSLAIIENNTIRNNSGSRAGGIGVTLSNGTISIVNNQILYNSSDMGPAGIGFCCVGGTGYISGNTVVGNDASSVATMVPGGIGIKNSKGGTIIIDNNTIASNRAPDNSHVGGIGLHGMSAESLGVLDNIYITSNRISNHRFGPTANQDAIAFKWMDFSTMFIRNNNKDGLGLSNNSCGIRFHSLADGVNVSIQNNLIRDNVNPTSAGGAGIEFMNSNNIDVVMDNNIISNCGWETPGNGDNKAVIAFQNCNQYSDNLVEIRRNQINTSNAHGVQFTAMNGVVAGGNVAKIFIGTDLDASGASNNIINLPAEMRAIEFSDNNTGDIGVVIKNNNNLEGGIALSDNKLYYLTIEGNTNIFSGQKGSGADAGYAGIQARDNVAGMRGGSSNNPIPVNISNNGIRDNRYNGIILNPGSVYWDISIANNTIEDNKRSGISLTLANAVTIQNNTIVSNGLDDYSEGGLYYASGIQARDITFSNVTGNTLRNNKFTGIQLYNTGGTIGPNNVIKFNGDADESGVCPGVGGSPRGGISVRDLNTGVILSVANNTVTSNYYQTRSLKPGSCDETDGEFWYEGSLVPCGGTLLDSGSAGIFIENAWNITTNGGINFSNIYTDSTGKVSIYNKTLTGDGTLPIGIAIMGELDDVTVKNCTISGFGTNENYTQIGPNNEYLGAGILAGGGGNPYLDGNTIYNNGGATEELDDMTTGYAGVVLRCANSTLVNNTIYNQANDGVAVYDGGGQIGLPSQPNYIEYNGRFGIASLSLVNNLKVGYNTITNNDDGMGGDRLNGSNFSIYNNYFYYNINDSDGAKKFGVGFTMFNGDVTIENNYFDQNRRGVVLENIKGGDVLIKGNTMVNSNAPNNANALQGIQLEKAFLDDSGVFSASLAVPLNITVENNTVDNYKAGIRYRYLQSTLANVYVFNNSVTNNLNNGIMFLSVYNTTVHSNYIDGNSWNGNNNANWSALRFEYLYDGGMVTITNNTITNSHRSGIEMRDSADATISIANNYIYGNSTRTDLGNLAGLRFENIDSSSISLINNNINNNLQDGILFQENDGSDIVIEGGSANYNTQDGLAFKENLGCIIRVNDIDIINNEDDGVIFRDNFGGSGGSITISNSTITNNADNGVIFRDNYDDLDDILIANNTITYNNAGVWVRNSENTRIEGNNLNYNDNVVIRGNQSSFIVGPSDSYIFSFQRDQCFGGATKYLMKDIFNTGMAYNDTSACSGRGWFAYEFMEDEPRFNEVRWGGSWGIQVRGYKSDGRPDNDTATEWRTAASDTTFPHSLTYNLGGSRSIEEVRIFAHYEALDWNVYCDGGATPITSFTAGGNPQVAWYYSGALTATCSSLKLESDGGADGRIYRDFFELEIKIGGSWYNLKTYNATSNPYGLSGSIASRCSKEDDDEDWGLDKAHDGIITTQWVTHPGDFSHEHWIAFDLGSDISGIDGLRVYTGTGASHSWSASVSRSVMTPVLESEGGTIVNNNWTFGGTSDYQTISFTGVTGRYIRMETTGIDPVRIKDHFYALQYTTDGGQSWDNPPGVTGNGYASVGGSGPMACSMMGRYSHTLGIIGGQYRGAVSNETGLLGDNMQAYMYATFMGGGVETIAATDSSTVIWENSSSHGNNLIQCKDSSVVHMRNGCFLNQKTRTKDMAHLWIMDNNWLSGINCLNASGGCPDYCNYSGMGGTTHVIDHNTVNQHTGARGAIRVIFNGGNTANFLSACSGGFMDFTDGNIISNTLTWYCNEMAFYNSPNCNTINGPNGCHPTGCGCPYTGCP